MKEKVKVLVPQLVIETLNKDIIFYGITKERLCNEILLKFSLKYRSNYYQEIFFEEKEYLQFNLNKENKRFYGELLETLEATNESEVIREIFVSYAVLCPELREINLYREKIYFILNSIKEYRELKIDTLDGTIVGRIEKLFRCKIEGYLKIFIKSKEYYISQIRIIN